MAAQTGLQLRTEVLNYGLDSTTYASRIDTWLKAAVREIVANHDLPLKLAENVASTVANVATVALPADFVRMHSLVNTTTPHGLREVDLRDIDMIATATGTPTIFAVDRLNSTVVLAPTPDSAYTLAMRYQGSATSLADTVTTGLGEEFDPAVIHYAVAQCYLAEDDPQMYQTHMSEYNRHASVAASNFRYQSQGPRQVRGMWT